MSFHSVVKHIAFLSILMIAGVSQGQNFIRSHCDHGIFCLKLSMIAANISSYLDMNTTFAFEEGIHLLDSEISVTGVEILLLTNNNVSKTTTIICSDNIRLIFTNINELSISGLNFSGCSVTATLVNEFILEDSSFNGENVNSSALKLNQTNANVLGSSFVSYTAGIYQKSVQFLDEVDHPYSLVRVLSHNARIGGALYVTNSNLTITDSHFENNSAQLGGAIFVEVGSSMVINDSTFVGNSASGCTDDCCNGGALFIDSDCKVIAHNSIFENNTSEFSGGAIALFRGAFKGVQNDFNFNRARSFGGCIFAH